MNPEVHPCFHLLKDGIWYTARSMRSRGEDWTLDLHYVCFSVMLLHPLHLDLIPLPSLSLIACHEGFDNDGNQANTCGLKQQGTKLIPTIVLPVLLNWIYVCIQNATSSESSTLYCFARIRKLILAACITLNTVEYSSFLPPSKDHRSLSLNVLSLTSIWYWRRLSIKTEQQCPKSKHFWALKRFLTLQRPLPESVSPSLWSLSVPERRS